MVRKTPKEIRKALKEHHTRKAGCEGKRKYMDEGSARSRATWDKENFRGAKRKAEGAHRPYRCKFCGYWHLGTIKNPAFRADYEERIKQGMALHMEVPLYKPWTGANRPDLSNLVERGMIRKEDLVHGEYYIGYAKWAVVARWHGENELFYYQARRLDKAGVETRSEAKVPHAVDDRGGDIFVPVDKTLPTHNQRVHEQFGDSPEGK